MKHRILIIQRHPIFSQGLQEMLRGKRDVAFVEIVSEETEARTLVRDKQIDVVIIDAKENDVAAEGIAFLRDCPNVTVIAVTPDNSRMYAYGKRDVESVDFKALLAAIRGRPDPQSTSEPTQRRPPEPGRT